MRSNIFETEIVKLLFRKELNGSFFRMQKQTKNFHIALYKINRWRRKSLKNNERRIRKEREYKRMYSLEKDIRTESVTHTFHASAYNVKPLSAAALSLIKR